MVRIITGETSYLDRMVRYVDDCHAEIGGVTKAQAAAMLAGSMFGWEVPAADPKNYDEQGRLIKPKCHDCCDAR